MNWRSNMRNIISFFKGICKQIRYVKILIYLLQKRLNFQAIRQDIQSCWFVLRGSEPARYDLFRLTTRLIENCYWLQMRLIHIVLMMIHSVFWTNNLITKVVWTKLRSFSCKICLNYRFFHLMFVFGTPFHFSNWPTQS